MSDKVRFSRPDDPEKFPEGVTVPGCSNCQHPKLEFLYLYRKNREFYIPDPEPRVESVRIYTFRCRKCKSTTRVEEVVKGA